MNEGTKKEEDVVVDSDVVHDDDEEEEFILTKVVNGNDTDDNDNDVGSVYLCRERHYDSWNIANIWIIVGERMDLIVDTGLGLWDLPKFLCEQKRIIGQIDTKTGKAKPYLAIATHVHFDHSGGLYQFQQRQRRQQQEHEKENDDDSGSGGCLGFGIHEKEVPAIVNGNSYEACCFLSRSDTTKVPTSSSLYYDTTWGKKEKKSSVTPNKKNTIEHWSPSDYKLQKAIPSRILKNW